MLRTVSEASPCSNAAGRAAPRWGPHKAERCSVVAVVVRCRHTDELSRRVDGASCGVEVDLP
jgi:hypothetical protein